MERFNALGRGAQLMLVGAVLLFVDLFLPWQDFDIGDLGQFSGWRGVGVIVGILTIVLLAWLIVRLASVNIPLPVSSAMTAALIGTLILIFTVIKMLTILGDETTIWAWIGLVLAVLIAVGAFQVVQEAGGVDQLKSEASSLGSQGGSAPATEPVAPAPPAPAAPAAPAPRLRRHPRLLRPSPTSHQTSRPQSGRPRSPFELRFAAARIRTAAKRSSSRIPANTPFGSFGNIQ